MMNYNCLVLNLLNVFIISKNTNQAVYNEAACTIPLNILVLA
jgi:hypothetical protein